MDLSICPPFGGFELQAHRDAAVGILPPWEMQACTLHTSVMHLPRVQATISGGEYKPGEERKLMEFPVLKASEAGRDQKRAEFLPFSRSWRRGDFLVPPGRDKRVGSLTRAGGLWWDRLAWEVSSGQMRSCI